MVEKTEAELAGSIENVVARLERLPISRWHVKARFIVGIATFFDGVDALAIAYVLPMVAPQWHLTPSQIGLLLSASFVGQFLAALVFGWLAEHYGRMPIIVWSTVIYSVMSFACAFSWDFTSLLVMRTIQGIGIGGEVPVAIAYISEISKTEKRGRFMLLYELVFPIGLVCAVLIGILVVPHLGWQSLFIIGGLPALLAFFMQRLLPESPRWLATHGRAAEADAVVRQIEEAIEAATGAPLAEVRPVVYVEPRRASIADIFGAVYLPRTISVWVMWSCCFFCNFGLATWLPSLYRSVYQLDVSTALELSFVTQIVGLAGAIACALLIDRFGRRSWFSVAFAAATLAFLLLWLEGAKSATSVALLGSVAYFFISVISIGLYLYTPEIYPTRVRAIGMTTANCWSRIASFLGPNVVGALVAGWGLPSVFLAFAIAGAVAAFTTSLLVVETGGRVLEEVSP